jgi:hypothetical protein
MAENPAIELEEKSDLLDEKQDTVPIFGTPDFNTEKLLCSSVNDLMPCIILSAVKFFPF